MKKITAVILAFAMCFVLLCSCAGEKKANVISVKDGKGVSINFIYLLTAMNKAMYKSAVDQSSGGNWNSVVYKDEGITWADLLMQVVLEDTENFLICEYLFDNKYGLELTKDDEILMENEYNSFVEAAGSKKNFEDMLSEYSADPETFKRYLELTVKQLKIQDYLYGTEGISKISDEEIKSTFENEYSVVTHIYFNTVTTTTADGKIITMSQEEATAKTELANSVFTALSAGEDFYALKEQYSEDTYESQYYPNGFFVTNDNTFPTPFTTAALEMKEGEYRLVDSGNGIHIMLKLPMDETLYNSDASIYNKIYARLTSVKFDKVMEENLKIISVNKEGIDNISSVNVQNIPEFALLVQ